MADNSSLSVSLIDHAKANDNDPDNDLTFKLQPSDFALIGDGKTVTLNIPSSKLPDGFGNSIDVQVRYLRRGSMQVTVNGTPLAASGIPSTSSTIRFLSPRPLPTAMRSR